MNLIYLALLCGMIATIFVYKSEARLHVESIVGGTASALHQNTYAVSIQSNDLHRCGGAILNNRYILTAAHPFIDRSNNRFRNVEYTVVAGAIQAHNREERYRVKREVAKIYIPRAFYAVAIPNFAITKTADIAVLELASDLGLNQFITNVVLPPLMGPHLTYEHEQAVVCGYGHNFVTMRQDPRTHQEVEVCSGSISYERRFAQVNIISNRACRTWITGIRSSHLCGSMVQRSRAIPEGLCAGDSGNPLVIGNTIIGVVSSSPLGSREDLSPALYTRVTSFIQSITHAINGVQAADMRLAKYEVGRGHTKVLVE